MWMCMCVLLHLCVAVCNIAVLTRFAYCTILWFSPSNYVNSITVMSVPYWNLRHKERVKLLLMLP